MRTVQITQLLLIVLGTDLFAQDYVLLQDSSILPAKVVKVYSPAKVRIKESRAEYDISMPQYLKIIYGNKNPTLKVMAWVKLKDGSEVAGFIVYGDSASLMIWKADPPYMPRRTEWL